MSTPVEPASNGDTRPNLALARGPFQERVTRSSIAAWENVLCVGIACVDIVDELACFPDEDSEQRSLGRIRRLGGNGANMLCTLSQFDGAKSSLMFASAPRESDPNVAFVGDELCRFNVTQVPVLIKEWKGTVQMPTSYILQSRLTGSRTIIHYRNIPELTCADMAGNVDLSTYTWVHFEGRSGPDLEGMLRASVHAGCTISLEIEKPRPPFDMLTLLRYCNVVMIGKDFVKAQGFAHAREFLVNLWSQRQTLGIKLHAKIVLPWGEEGAFGIAFGENVTRDEAEAGPEIIYAPAATLDKPILDSVGAGDVFNGSLVVGLLRGQPLHEAMRFACNIAGGKCTQQGLEHLTKFVSEDKRGL
ncbi:Ketohexokinase [Hondaea fermentalgiana]|uniref:Ketohexokinase n=1 Tax=Hondaea fermentalgiana TaxID=2315210 RepID=A0A2R5GLU1_9STRA|nr:Ketohexokinase [Hondaea fermentalgiana]|eukprot:GBG29251.1 Ketohexokinase [Hondaea fermentalgiana]